VIIDVGVADPRANPPVSTPTTDARATRRELERDGIRVVRRGGFIVRLHPDGWVERVARVDPGAAVLATDDILIVVNREPDAKRSGDALALRLVGPTDAFRVLTLPPWVAGRGETIDLALAERYVVIRTPERAAWILVERLNWLARVGNGPVKFCATIPGRTEAYAVVTRGGDHRAVVEGASGKRIMLMTQVVPVTVGERLLVREIGGDFALVNAAGETVARESTIELVRTAPKGSSAYPDHDTENSIVITATAFAAEVLNAATRGRLERLSALGLAPGLDREALEQATVAAFRLRNVPRHPALRAAKVLYEHFLTNPLPASRALLGGNAVERAMRENVDLTETRWHLVMMPDYEPFALCLSGGVRDAIVTRELLLLEPVPAYEPLPADPEAVCAWIVRLLGCADDEVRLAPAGRQSATVQLRMTLRAAALLEQSLGDPDSSDI
jgi:hypothetical protein